MCEIILFLHRKNRKDNFELVIVHSVQYIGGFHWVMSLLYQCQRTLLS